MFALLILLSQKQDPSRNVSFNLIKMCKCVGFFFGWWMNSFAWSISLLVFFFLDMGYIFFFFSSFFRHVLWTCGIPSLGMHLFSFLGTLFFSCLLGMWHTFFGYASFISFCIAHILDGNLGERVMIELGVLFCEWMEIIAIFKW